MNLWIDKLPLFLPLVPNLYSSLSFARISYPCFRTETLSNLLDCAQANRETWPELDQIFQTKSGIGKSVVFDVSYVCIYIYIYIYTIHILYYTYSILYIYYTYTIYTYTIHILYYTYTIYIFVKSITFMKNNGMNKIWNTKR